MRNDELRGLLLDFDGTIADTERLGHRVAYNRAFAQLGLDWDWDERLYAELLGVAGGKERLRSYVERYRPGYAEGAELDRLLDDVYRAKIRIFATIAPAIPLRPGVRRLIHEAHAAGVHIAVATTASRTGVEAVLSQDPELAPMIAVVAAAEEVERKKPAPDVYLWALERLGLPASACVAIEDSNVGLRAALAAGLPAVVAVSDFTAGEDFTGAVAVLSDLGEYDRPATSLRGPSPALGVVDLAYLDAIRRTSRDA